MEKGILLKVLASCKPSEMAATPCFSVRAVDNEKNTGEIRNYISKELRENQHTYGINFTTISCDKDPDQPCSLPPDFTWHRKSEGERLFKVKGTNRGQPAWHYVVLVDDEETIKKFKEKTQDAESGKHPIDVSEYGQVVKSGWGEEPPNEVKDWIEKTYQPDTYS